MCVSQVPDEIANMPELEMFLSAIDLAKMVELQEEFNDQLWQVSGTGADDIVLLVNGQTEPVVSMDRNAWEINFHNEMNQLRKKA